MEEILVQLTAALHRVASALESEKATRGEFALCRTQRYTQGADDQSGVVSEETMAKLLGISRRTLAEHRRNHRLDGCWVRNGRRYFWDVAATRAAWQKGIG